MKSYLILVSTSRIREVYVKAIGLNAFSLRTPRSLVVNNPHCDISSATSLGPHAANKTCDSSFRPKLPNVVKEVETGRPQRFRNGLKFRSVGVDSDEGPVDFLTVTDLELPS